MFKRTHQMLALVMLLLISTIAQAQDTTINSAAAKRLKIILGGKQTVIVGDVMPMPSKPGIYGTFHLLEN